MWSNKSKNIIINDILFSNKIKTIIKLLSLYINNLLTILLLDEVSIHFCKKLIKLGVCVKEYTSKGSIEKDEQVF